jgi:DNA polymerase-1
MKYASIDIETTGLDRFKHDINYIGIGVAEEIGQPLKRSIILNMHEGKDLARFQKIVGMLKRDKTKLIWQNGKFDTLFIEHKYGIRLPIHHDIMLMGTAYDLAASHALDDMAERYLGIKSWDIPLKVKIQPNNPIVEEYLGSDIEVPWLLFGFFNKRMNENQWQIYNEILKPAYLMYRDSERYGIWLDQVALKEVQKKYKKGQKDALAVLKARADINWNSSAQLQKILFDEEGLPAQKLSEKTGKPSTDASSLKRLAAKGYELPQKILDYKFYFGANSKFLNRWGEYAAFDGRIHPNFGITNVITGRTSCKDPNLQQVPRNKELRTLFTAPPGRVLIEADYSQLELRIAADYANEPTMLRIYNEGGDIHTETAMTMTGGVAPSKEDRSRAKPVNFGFLYGMGAGGFVNYAFNGYGVVFTKSESERFRELFFAKYARLLQWHEEMAELCEIMGGVENRFGRFRALPKIYSQHKWERNEAIRRAINTPVQGTGSDLLIASAAQINKELRKEFDLHIVGTIHDSVLAECPEECAEDAAKEIKRIMEHPYIMDSFGVSFKIPLEVDVGIGAWGSK